jgi:Spy/CpxP family protein refolding chaperone
MENARFLKITIILLLVINLGTLSYLWMDRHHEHPTGGPHGPGQDVFTFLCNELKLDEQQTKQYGQLRDEHHHAVENLQNQVHQLREQFFGMIHKNPVDSSAVKNISDSIATIQEQIELATFYHFQKVRSILRPEQQTRFDEVIQQATRMMGGPPIQGPPPPRPN